MPFFPHFPRTSHCFRANTNGEKHVRREERGKAIAKVRVTRESQAVRLRHTNAAPRPRATNEEADLTLDRELPSSLYNR